MVRKVTESKLPDKKKLKKLQDATAIQQKMVKLKPGCSEWLKLASEFARLMDGMTESVIESKLDTAPTDDGIVGITMQDVITAVKSNYDNPTETDVIDTFQTILGEQEDDARFTLEQNMENILKQCK